MRSSVLCPALESSCACGNGKLSLWVRKSDRRSAQLWTARVSQPAKVDKGPLHIREKCHPLLHRWQVNRRKMKEISQMDCLCHLLSFPSACGFVHNLLSSKERSAFMGGHVLLYDCVLRHGYVNKACLSAATRQCRLFTAYCRV